MRDNLTRILAGLFFLALVALGLWGNRFHQFLTMQVMLLSIFALGYNVLFGRTGLLSFGHGALYAAGAYGMGLFYLHVSGNPLLGILVGVATAAFIALVLGFFCVRHTEIYFAMLTLAFGMLIFSLIWSLSDITGGDDGLVGIGRDPINLGFISLPIQKSGQFYFLVLFFFALSLWLIRRIRNSPFGLVLAGIKANSQRTQFAGVDVRRYRLAAFVISGVFAGLAGALSAMLEFNTDPFSAHWTHSGEPIFVSIIGGMGTLFGPVVGSVVFIMLRQVVEAWTEYWMFWFGLLLLAIILGFRGGVVGAVSQWWEHRQQEAKGGGR